MDIIHKLKGDKAPFITGSTPKDVETNIRSAIDSVWRKVANLEYEYNTNSTTIKSLKTDISEKIVTKKLRVTGQSVFDGGVYASSGIYSSGTSSFSGNLLVSGTIDVSGIVHNYNETYFGDVSGGNYTKVESNGTVVSIGDATTYRDEVTDALKLQQVGTGVSINNTDNTVEFNTVSNLSDYVYTNVQLNHDREIASVIYPHIHWFQTVSGNPNFLLQYRWQVNGQQKVSGWTGVTCNNPVATYVSGTLNQISFVSGGLTPPSGSDLSDIVQFRILRDNANTSTLFSGVDPVAVPVGFTSFDVHVKMDMNGSRTQYSK